MRTYIDIKRVLYIMNWLADATPDQIANWEPIADLARSRSLYRAASIAIDIAQGILPPFEQQHVSHVASGLLIGVLAAISCSAAEQREILSIMENRLRSGPKPDSVQQAESGEKGEKGEEGAKPDPDGSNQEHEKGAE